jgi:hypothetical protein
MGAQAFETRRLTQAALLQPGGHIKDERRDVPARSPRATGLSRSPSPRVDQALTNSAALSTRLFRRRRDAPLSDASGKNRGSIANNSHASSASPQVGRSIAPGGGFTLGGAWADLFG